MIESETARQLVELILHIEERLARLIASGWRQARAEAADLQQSATALTEAGLPHLAARIAAVATATDAASALHTLALASSACRQMRARLLVGEAPDGWQQIQPPRARKRTTEDTVVPLARLQVAEREVWACSWPARNQVVLLEPPFPAPPEDAAAPADTGGLIARSRRLLERALHGAGDQSRPSLWLHRRLQGTLRWEARYPLGAAGDIAACTLHDAEWQTNPDGADQDQLRAFRTALAANKVREEASISWSVSGLRVMRLDRNECAAYAWLDESAAAAFRMYGDLTPLALVWLTDNVVAPLALLEPGESGRQPRIVHLVTGLPTDVVSTVS
jgi:hypothetical protein